MWVGDDIRGWETVDGGDDVADRWNVVEQEMVGAEEQEDVLEGGQERGFGVWKKLTGAGRNLDNSWDVTITTLPHGTSEPSEPYHQHYCTCMPRLSQGPPKESVAVRAMRNMGTCLAWIETGGSTRS